MADHPNGPTDGDNLFLTAQQAAEILQVSVDTLYSYISRKKIRTQKLPGSRQRLYWREDIDRVKAGLWKRSSPSKDAPRDTSITLLTPSAHYYRGRNAIELSRTFTLEQTAALLWECAEGEAFGPQVAYVPPELGDLSKLLSSSSSTDKAIALLPFLEHANPKAYDMSHAGMCRTGADVMRWYCAILADAPEPTSEPLHLQIAASVDASRQAADLIRRTLVLSADYSLGAGTFAVRAVASTGVSSYRSVLAGLALTSGKRSRLGMAVAVSRFLLELGQSGDPRQMVIQRLREGTTVLGFDSPPPYETHDPRAHELLARIEDMFGDHVLVRNVRAAAAVMAEVKGIGPSFVLANVLLSLLIGLDSTKVLYILGRCAGWIAHSIEQYQEGEMFAPAVLYKGNLPT